MSRATNGTKLADMQLTKLSSDPSTVPDEFRVYHRRAIAQIRTAHDCELVQPL